LRELVQHLLDKGRDDYGGRPGLIRYLLDRGWFFTLDLPSPSLIQLNERRKAGDHDGVDAIMVGLARAKVDEVEAALRERFPHRTKVLVDAFENHRAGKYTVSIPTFLSQADGVGCEVLAVPRQFFSSKPRAEALKEKLGAFALSDEPSSLGGAMKELLAPLDDCSSITAQTDQRDERQRSEPWYGPLNRHAVLHGHDLSYATEANSLRCVLLLQYLLDVDRTLYEETPGQLAELQGKWNP
jgi:hypothetical protein